MTTGTPVAVIDGVGDGISLGVVSVGPFSVALGAAIFVAVAECVNSGNGLSGGITISDSQGLAWTQIGAISDGSNQLYVFRAFSNGNAMSISVTDLKKTAGLIQVVSVANAQNEAANVKTASGGSSLSDTLPSAPATTSAVLAFVLGRNNGVITPQTAGMTELNQLKHAKDGNASTVVCLETIYDVGSPAQSASWTSTCTKTLAVMVEVKDSTPVDVGSVKNLSAAASFTFGATASLGRRLGFGATAAASFTGSAALVRIRGFAVAGPIAFAGTASFISGWTVVGRFSFGANVGLDPVFQADWIKPAPGGVTWQHEFGTGE